MENIIIGFNDGKRRDIIKEMVTSNGFYNVYTCSNGDEILRCANESAGGIVICGYKVGNTIYTDIYDMLPENFNMLLLLSRKQADIVDNDKIFYIVLPVSKADVIKTINVILSFNHYSDENKNANFNRSEDDKIIIERAKLYLMNKYNVTESSAHRFLQKNSMNRAIKMADMAKIILNI